MRVLILIFLIGSQAAFGQVADYQRDYNKINEHLMLTLGGYAVGNFAVSGVGYFTTQDENVKRFHEMNVMWNTVNFGLAIPGYIKAKKNGGEFSLSQMNLEQRKTERVFLVNSVLDVGYISAGYWMRTDAMNRGDREALFRGYGNSLMLQGGFLFAFDLVAFAIHKQHFNVNKSLFEKVSMSTTPQGIRLAIQLDS